MSGLFEIFAGEIRDARMQDREITQIRVTTDALQGSVVTIPMTPERSRTRGLAATGSETVDTDPRLIGRPPLEIVIHPRDWAEILKSTDLEKIVGFGLYAPVDRIMGIPIKEER